MTKWSKHATEKKPEQILFSKNTYVPPKVKVAHWDFALNAEKKDNYVYRDQLSNHLSTYNRWGDKDIGTGMTETRHMLAQVFTKEDPVYPFKPLVNFTSYPCTEGLSVMKVPIVEVICWNYEDIGTTGNVNVSLVEDIERRVNAGNRVYGALKAVMGSQKIISQKARVAVHREVLVPTRATRLRVEDLGEFSPIKLRNLTERPGQKYPENRDLYLPVWERGVIICMNTPGRNRKMKKANLAQLPPDFGVMDYMTTQQDDYRNPFPSVAKPLTMPRTPWLLNRVIRSDLTHNHGTAPPRGDYQCLDTHTPIGHIRQLRLFRYQSFDPATCVQDFPTLKTSLDKNDKANEI